MAARRVYLGVATALALLVLTCAGATAAPTSSSPANSATFASAIANVGADATTFASAISADRAVERVAPLDTSICYVNQDDPHYSKGARGVIAKSRFICDSGRTAVYSLATLSLWECAVQVPASVSINTLTARYGCNEVAYENYTNISVGQGQTVTRYVPNTGKRGLTGKAYYFAATGYKVSGNSTEYFTTMNSPSPYVNGNP